MKKVIFTELFEQYRLPLFRYLMQMCRNRELAEELLQETFYRAMVSLKVKDVLQARGWLYKVARNLYIDSTRKAKAEQQMVGRVQSAYPSVSSLGDPQQELESKTRQQELKEILHMLPERMQTILYLREVQDFSYKELALAMNLSESQVKITLHRAREKFRYYDRIKKGDEFDG
ncbi:sigma-70 family RNA polymerase sigma factor [Aquibacillus koreensis]|uniref:Sigma-70 family RNA polymerase sigma factor n=1 Tax=Aquibacillus koreensis TaxID=279446 RepID=A0A9X3WGZ1_9BACI|nr:sigma-70 family RNA polymerase sigma factor [Aquibacillus koreensis]MCT2534807.1 sigma-70 family RNA polymerase sigma factor [Aquibacillus koreensis]MDC3419582.1 sigma-70 family RNA polymerase sigma factor [Aquibacillus koreensis]